MERPSRITRDLAPATAGTRGNEVLVCERFSEPAGAGHPTGRRFSARNGDRPANRWARKPGTVRASRRLASPRAQPVLDPHMGQAYADRSDVGRSVREARASRPVTASPKCCGQNFCPEGSALRLAASISTAAVCTGRSGSRVELCLMQSHVRSLWRPFQRVPCRAGQTPGQA